MKKLLKIFLVTLFFLVICISGALAYVRFSMPNVGPPAEITIKADSETLRHGEYLVKNVMACLVCHSTRDWTKFSAPVVPGTEGRGSDEFSRKNGLPGNFMPKNITPTHLGKWTDGEILRAVTAGVSKDGRPLFPIMPYGEYGQLDEADLKAAIAYLRTIPAKEDTVPPSEADFPFSLILRTIPKRAAPAKRPDPSDAVSYGKYMTRAALCFECHTKIEKGTRPAEMAFAGGFEFALPDGSVVRSANITPDQETGIGNMTKEAFVRRFKAYDPATYKPHTVGSGDFNTVMPWTVFAGMTEQDLGAIYEYVRTVRPVSQKIERFTPASKAAAMK
ncbi:MAG TPA: cytochrome C [Blastocatellia bacterium]|nr:cytochrome C [Blastocatellia bacterium]